MIDVPREASPVLGSTGGHEGSTSWYEGEKKEEDLEQSSYSSHVKATFE
jgi:hypothetical protein